MTTGENLTIGVGGGGTGGHIVPALNICGEIINRVPNAKIHYVGAPGSLEERLAFQAGFTFHPVKITPLRRSLRLSNLTLPFIMAKARSSAAAVIRREKIKGVIATGGYSAWPIASAAAGIGLPLAIQEQNAVPGLVNRMLARRAHRIYLAFPEAAERLTARTEKVRITGNPVRLKFSDAGPTESRVRIGVNPKLPTLLIMGGSGGAESINRAATTAFSQIMRLGLNLIWQTGRREVMPLETTSEAKGRAIVRDFFNPDEMAAVYCASSAAVCRAGAMTLAELAMAGLPALLVPYPFASAGHQDSNARAYKAAGGALILEDRRLTAETLIENVKELLRPETNRRMSAAIRSLAKPEAAADIADDFLGLIGC